MDPLAGRLVEQLQDDPEAPEVVGLEGEDADVIFDALSSETTRAVLSQCYDGGRTRSELADDLDTSIQNVSYHVEKLEGAGLIEPAEIRYGENGQEVRVYEPSKEAVLIAAGETGVVARLKQAVDRLLSPVLLLGLFSAALAVIVRGVETVPFGLAGSQEDAAPTDDETAQTDKEDSADAETMDSDGGATDDGKAMDDDGGTMDDRTGVEDSTFGKNASGENVTGDADVPVDAGPDAGAETLDALLTDPSVIAGLGVFLFGLVFVVTLDRFGTFDRRPRRERMGTEALLFGTYTATTWRFLGGALGLALVTFLLLDASRVGEPESVRTVAFLGVQATLLLGGIAGVFHAYRNRGLAVTVAVVGAPLCSGWAYLVAAPMVGRCGLEGIPVALVALVFLVVLVVLPLGGIAYLLGRGIRRWRTDDDTPTPP